MCPPSEPDLAVSLLPLSSSHNNDLWKMKTARHTLEQKFVTSGLTIHKVFCEHQKACSVAFFFKACLLYYSSIIQSSSDNPKLLFSTVSHLHPCTAPNSDQMVDQQSTFLGSFSTKISSVRSAVCSASTQSKQTLESQLGISEPLCPFFPVSQPEIFDIMRTMKPATCTLDPFPSSLIKTYIFSSRGDRFILFF